MTSTVRFRVAAAEVRTRSHWFHMTKVVDKLSMGFTGRAVNKFNYRHVYDQLSSHCANPPRDISIDNRGATPNLHKENCAVVRNCRKVGPAGTRPVALTLRAPALEAQVPSRSGHRCHQEAQRRTLTGARAHTNVHLQV